MLLSAQQTFSDGQVVTSDANATNVIDLGEMDTVLGAPAALKRYVGKGTPVPIVIQVTAASGTSPTLDVSLVMDTAAAMSSETTVASAPQVTGTGRVSLWFLPEQITERYITLDYDVGGTSPSFTIDAFIPAADQTNTVPGV